MVTLGTDPRTGAPVGYGIVPDDADPAGPPPVTEPAGADLANGAAELHLPRRGRDPFRGTELDVGEDPGPQGEFLDMPEARTGPWKQPPWTGWRPHSQR